MPPLHRLKSIFGDALALPLAERQAFLDTACGEDTALRSEVEQLLAAHDRQGTLPAATPVSTLTAGTILAGRYTLQELIGEGGMGRVWRAKQSEPVARDVAVKILRAGADTKAVLDRFNAERQALARMDHPAIAAVFDGGTCGGSPFFAMELVRGEPITAFAKNLDVEEKLKLFIPVCRAVQHAHTKGIIHRDLKPANILVTRVDGRPVPKVIDFGVAKAVGERLTDVSLADTGLLIGTPQYMSPEQAESSPDIDTRSDVYALGAVLYEVLTGRPAIAPGGSLLELLYRISEVEPQALDNHPVELDGIVRKALSKDRELRYESPTAFAADLERYLAHEPVEARPPTRAYRLRKFVRRNRGAVVAASLVMLSLLGGIVASLLALQEAKAQEHRAFQAKADEETQRLAAEENERRALKAKEDEAKQRKTAETERDNATAIRQFLRRDLLQQADASNRAEDFRRGPSEYNANPRIKDLLDRTYTGLAPDRIAEKFPNKEVQGAILSTVGDTYLTIGEFGRAIEILERVAALGAELHGPDAKETLQARYNLGLARMHDQQFAAAGVIFESVLAARRRLLGPQHEDTLGAQNAVATCWCDSKRVAEGIALLEATRDALVKTVGPEHATSLATLNNLAMAYQKQKKYAEAIAMLESIVAVETKQRGVDHPRTLVTRANLALAKHAAGQSDDAVKMYENIIEARLRVLGPDHRSVASAYTQLARIHFQRKNWPQAAAWYEKAHAAGVRIRGAEDRDTLVAANNLAWTTQKAGDTAKAIEVYERVLDAQRRTIGSGHSDTLATLINLGLALEKLGHSDRATTLMREAANGSEKLNFDHTNADVVTHTFIEQLAKHKHYAEAEPWRRKLADREKKRSGAMSGEYAYELYNLTSLLVPQEKWKDAEPVYREILTVLAKTDPEEWSRFNVMCELGTAILKQGRPAEAKDLLIDGWTGLKAREAQIPANGKFRLPQALDRLIEYATVTKDEQALKQWQTERNQYK